MKKLIGVAIMALALTGCATVAPSVQEGNAAAVEIVQTAMENVAIAIDKWAEECVILVTRDYENDREAAKRKLITEGGGMVDLDRWLKVSASYDVEIEKSRNYYLSKAADMKEAIANELGNALLLLNLNQEYLEKAGIPPEEFEALLNNVFTVVDVGLTESRAKDERDAAASEARRALEQEKWRDRINQIMGYLQPQGA